MAANAQTINFLDRKHFVASALFILALGALLRFYHLGVEELWLDESWSAHMVSQKWSWEFVLEENTPPLYYVLLKLWRILAGDSEFSLRALSALAGSLFVLATIWMGKELFDEAVGLWSGVFVAINPMAIYYSQEARVYALLLLCLTLAYTHCWLALQNGAFKNWLLFCLFAILALYAHYLAPFALAPTLVLLLVWPARERKGHPWRNYALVAAICALTFFPMAAAKFVSFRQSPGLVWLEPAWRQSSAWLLLPQSFEVFGLGSQWHGATLLQLKQMTVLDFPPLLRIFGLTLLAALALAAIVPWADRTLGVAWVGRRKVWLISLVCLPLLLLLGISWMQPLYAVGRYDLIGFPAYPILLALGMAKLQRVPRYGPWLAYAVALCLIGIICAKLLLYYRTSVPAERSNARATAAFLDEHIASGDVVVFTGLRGGPVIYYLERIGYDWRSGRCIHREGQRHFGCRIFPRKIEAHIGTYAPADSPDQIAQEARSLVQELQEEDSGLIVALGQGRVTREMFQLVDDDRLLMKELAALGYSQVRLNASLNLLNFRKPLPGETAQ